MEDNLSRGFNKQLHTKSQKHVDELATNLGFFKMLFKGKDNNFLLQMLLTS